MAAVDDLIKALNLQPHPMEGGFFRETYRSDESISHCGQSRSLATAIYYLLTPTTFSALHRLPTDEIFHFYCGSPVEMLQLWPDGHWSILLLGTEVLAGHHPQVVVPGGVWQGSRLLPGGEYALLGTTMAPGFDYADYEAGHREELIQLYPDCAERIRLLTHSNSTSGGEGPMSFRS
jgi:predicted cupin superfamily sugar epimerase